MKNGIYLTLILGVLFASLATDTPAQTDNSGADDNNGGYGRVYQSNGLAEATRSIQQNTQTQIQRAISQQAAANRSGKNPAGAANSSRKSQAFFTPAASGDNFKLIADTVGQDAEQRTLFRQLFADARRGFDAQLAPQGRKNNLAAAMTFFIATTVTIYNDAPEPTEEAQENLFQAISAMYSECSEQGQGVSLRHVCQFRRDTFGLLRTGKAVERQADARSRKGHLRRVAAGDIEN